MDMVKRLSERVLGRESSNNFKEDEMWEPGCRYKALAPFALKTDPWPESKSIGQVRLKEDVLVLALWPKDHNESPPDADVQDGPLYGYVGSTRRPEWMTGWVQLRGEQLGGSSSSSMPPKLGKQRQRLSWEVGGRYSVLGAPLLRVDKELDSEQMGEVTKDEEVLVVELALVMLKGEPRLRGRVRTDTGQVGWLTVELPWAGPLLRPRNLYSEEAARMGPPVLRRLSSCNGLRSSGMRLTLRGTFESNSKAWEAGGRYRLLTKAAVYPDQFFTSSHNKMGELKSGTLVQVLETIQVANVSHQGEPRLPQPNELHSTRLRLKILAVNDTGGAPKRGSLCGWIDAIGRSDKPVLDARDHTEYEKVMRLLQSQSQHPSDFRQGTPSKVPRLELQSLREPGGESPSPKGQQADLNGSDGDSEGSEYCTDSEEESESEDSPREMNSRYPLGPRLGDGRPPPKTHGDGHLAVVIESPRPVDNAIRSVAQASAAKTKGGGNSFVDARRPFPDDARDPFLTDSAGDDREVREPQAESSSFAPGCWLSCGTCCGGGTGVKSVPPQVKTSGASPHVFQRTDEHEHLVSHGPSNKKLPAAARSNGARCLPEPPDKA